MTVVNGSTPSLSQSEPDMALFTEIIEALDRVAEGDLKVRLFPREGPGGEVVNKLNNLIEMQQRSTRDICRIAKIITHEGRMGERISEIGYEGAWKDTIQAINSLIDSFVSSATEISQVITAVSEGDLNRHLALSINGRPLRGEILMVVRLVNTMVDRISEFVDEVTRVAREVGTEGKIGGQAHIRGTRGMWKDLTDSINHMIIALHETTRKNSEQSWLDSHLARISGLLQGQRDLEAVCRMIVEEVTPLIDAQLGAFFLREGYTHPEGSFATRMRMVAAYGYIPPDTTMVFAPGEGLVGQAAISQKLIRTRVAPADNVMVIKSGIVNCVPHDLVVIPILFEEESLGVIEFASASQISDLCLTFLDRVVVTIGLSIKTIINNNRTEELLAQSQRLAWELREQSVELQRTNAELEEKARQLLEQKRNIERKNQEIETARMGLEEKAQQLAKASRYKSEFLTNMSHELRTPLNSMLLLSRLLTEDPDGNMTPKQVEFAQTIHSAGSDLLALIDDILDLSKIEAGRMEIELSEIFLDEIRVYVDQVFSPQAEAKNLSFEIAIDPLLPVSIVTDPQWLQQILRNLLSNAIKFTGTGSVTLAIGIADSREYGPNIDHIIENSRSGKVVTFSVTDTGIGISDEKLTLIFDAFQQADGTTSRKYGGTGLGLSISRDLAYLLGGEIDVVSIIGGGSTFTLLIPEVPISDTLRLLSSSPVSLREESDRLAPPFRQDHAMALPSRGKEGPSNNCKIAEERYPAKTYNLRDVNILIIDDDVRNVFALTSALETRGMTVFYADNGVDGVRILSEYPEIDIILMDVMMPDQDGNEVTREIRRNRHFADLPVIFLTAKAMPADREESFAAGASGYITKPVDLDELLAVIAVWVNEKKSSI